MSKMKFKCGLKLRWWFKLNLATMGHHTRGRWKKKLLIIISCRCPVSESLFLLKVLIRDLSNYYSSILNNLIIFSCLKMEREKTYIGRNSNYIVLFRTKDIGKKLEKYCGHWNCETHCETQLVVLKAFKLHRITEAC